MSFVIRGLYYKTDLDDFKAALDEKVPNVISKVTKFNTTFSLKNKLDTGLFLISLLPGKGLKDISHINYLLNQTIVWENPKRKEQEIQCRRCQLWGHMAKNCNRNFKCVKCLGITSLGSVKGWAKRGLTRCELIADIEATQPIGEGVPRTKNIFPTKKLD